MLGEAYAFGVIWSFTFNALAMLVLRWKYKGERGWKVPLNIRLGKTEIPLGLFCVFLVLLTTAIVNLLTKSVATVSGIIFAAAFFLIFSLSERDNKRRHDITARQMKEHFQLEHQDTVGSRGAGDSAGRRRRNDARFGIALCVEVGFDPYEYRRSRSGRAGRANDGRRGSGVCGCLGAVIQ